MASQNYHCGNTQRRLFILAAETIIPEGKFILPFAGIERSPTYFLGRLLTIFYSSKFFPLCQYLGKNCAIYYNSRLKMIGSKVRVWRNYHRFCDMSKHSLWFPNQWLWKKLRKDKAGTLAQLKARELESLSIKHTNNGITPKIKGAAKRILTSLEIHTAFPPIPWKVNSHVMVKGAASPFDGNLTYWVSRKSKLYADSPTGKAMTRQKMVTAPIRR